MVDFVSPELERMAAKADALTEREKALALLLFSVAVFVREGTDKGKAIREFGKHLDYYLERQRQEWVK